MTLERASLEKAVRHFSESSLKRMSDAEMDSICGVGVCMELN